MLLVLRQLSCRGDHVTDQSAMTLKDGTGTTIDGIEIFA
jgi:hypothetical protein